MPSRSEFQIATVEPLHSQPWRVGDQVQRYRLLAHIAAGGMAEIWLARQAGPQGFEKVVVIKRMIDSLSTDPEFVEMFLDEARIAAQLSHPNVVQVFDLGEHLGAYYIAMEYLPGEHLAAVARAAAKAGTPLPIPLAVRVASLAADGLGFAHEHRGLDGQMQNIVHRDVSPHNIVITYDGQVKVVDFGIARAANRVSRTAAGQVKGKLAYMSPEQAKGQELDGRSDEFSLGVVLFEAVTRGRLYERGEDDQAVARALTGGRPFPAAHQRNPEVPLALSQIISRAMSLDRQQRYGSCRELRAALEEWLRTQPESPGAAQMAAYMSTLFTQRIAERLRVLEQARNGALTRSGEHRVMRTSNPSMPAQTARHRVRSRRLRLWPAAVVVAAALAGLSYLFFVRPEPTVMVVPPREVPQPEKPVEPKPPPVERPAIERPPEPRPVVLARGRLTFDSAPWTTVFLGSRKLGDTPLVELPLPVGRHTLRLVNESSRIDRTVEVEIRAGQTTTKKLRL